jgi:hypothetical protein
MALAASALTGRTEGLRGITCITKVVAGNADIGRVSALRDLPGNGVLLGSPSPVFLLAPISRMITSFVMREIHGINREHEFV